MFDGFDMGQLMAQAQAMQESLMQAQQDLAARSFTGSAGGDLVVVTLTGAGEVTDVRIRPEAVDPDDVDTLQDLVVAAFRAAKESVDEAAQAAMPELPPGIGM